MCNGPVHFQTVDDVTVATPQEPEITPKIGEVLRARLLELASAGQPAKFILDLSNLTFLGSIGLGVLVVFLKWVKASNAQLALAGLTKHCRNVMEVMGLNRVFKLHDSVSAAIEALQRAA